MPPFGVFMVNDTGDALSLQLAKEVRADGGWTMTTVEAPLAMGKSKFFGMPKWPERIVVSAGRCRYDYGRTLDLMALGAQQRVGVRLAPDFSAHLVVVDGYQRGQPLPGEPIVPVRICS